MKRFPKKYSKQLLSIIASLVLAFTMCGATAQLVYADEPVTGDDVVLENGTQVEQEAQNVQVEEDVPEEAVPVEEDAQEEIVEAAGTEIEALGDGDDEVSYPLWVGGVQVTSANAGNIPGVDSGKASYDATNKTLTLEDATITKMNDNNSNIDIDVDFSDTSGYKITLKGENKLSSAWAGIFFEGYELTIEGTGSLKEENVNNGIFANGKLTITGSIVNITKTGRGISSQEDITITNSTVIAACREYGIYTDSVNELKIDGNSKVHAEGTYAIYAKGWEEESGKISIGDGLGITEPVNGKIYCDSSNNSYIADKDNNIATSVTIEPAIDIKVDVKWISDDDLNAEVILDLYRWVKGSEAKEKVDSKLETLSSATEWHGEFDHVPKYDPNQNKYEYEVVETIYNVMKNGKEFDVKFLTDVEAKQLSDWELGFIITNTQPGADDDTNKPEPAPSVDKNAAKTALDASVKGTSSGGKVTAKWGKVAGASGYEVYAAFCGNKYQKIKDVGSGTTQIEITQIGGKKIGQKNAKYYVVAYQMVNGKKVQLAKSINAHIVDAKNTKYTNPKSIKAKKKYTLKKGKKAKIKAKLVLQKKGKKIVKHEAKFRYATSNAKVATVSKKGKIKAVGKGSCTVYVYAVNGCAKAIKVKVK